MIDILFYITQKQNDASYASDTLKILNNMTSVGNYSIGNQLIETSKKSLQIVFASLSFI